jgi:hypothetical protein
MYPLVSVNSFHVLSPILVQHAVGNHRSPYILRYYYRVSLSPHSVGMQGRNRTHVQRATPTVLHCRAYLAHLS